MIASERDSGNEEKRLLSLTQQLAKPSATINNTNNKNERIPQTKLVIRRLPPTMSEEEFIEQVSPLPEYDYLCYFVPETSLGQYAFCRAYINFMNHSDLVIFRDKFDNYVFLDKNGHEYLAVAEYSMWHKAPKDGPFYYKQSNDLDSDINTITTTTNTSLPSSSHLTTNKGAAVDSLMGTIEQDKDYLEFVENLDKQKKRVNNNVPSSTLEANLDELTNSSSYANKNNHKVMTPLLEFVKQKFGQQASSASTTTSTTLPDHGNSMNSNNNINSKRIYSREGGTNNKQKTKISNKSNINGGGDNTNDLYKDKKHNHKSNNKQQNNDYNKQQQQRQQQQHTSILARPQGKIIVAERNSLDIISKDQEDKQQLSPQKQQQKQQEQQQRFIKKRQQNNKDLARPKINKVYFNSNTKTTTTTTINSNKKSTMASNTS